MYCKVLTMGHNFFSLIRQVMDSQSFVDDTTKVFSHAKNPRFGGSYFFEIKTFSMLISSYIKLPMQILLQNTFCQLIIVVFV